MNTKSIQSVLNEFDEKFGMKGFEHQTDRIKDFWIKAIADLLEGEGSRIIGEDEVISMEMALGKYGKDFKLIEMNRNKLRASQKAHLAEVVLKIRKQV